MGYVHLKSTLHILVHFLNSEITSSQKMVNVLGSCSISRTSETACEQGHAFPEIKLLRIHLDIKTRIACFEEFFIQLYSESRNIVQLDETASYQAMSGLRDIVPERKTIGVELEQS